LLDPHTRPTTPSPIPIKTIFLLAREAPKKGLKACHVKAWGEAQSAKPQVNVFSKTFGPQRQPAPPTPTEGFHHAKMLREQSMNRWNDADARVETPGIEASYKIQFSPSSPPAYATHDSNPPRQQSNIW
jgi:hypothetical protein